MLKAQTIIKTLFKLSLAVPLAWILVSVVQAISTGTAELSWIPQAFADDLIDTGLDAVAGGVGATIAFIANTLVSVIGALIWFVLLWMPSLMDNSFILEGDMGARLQSVWIIMRNIVNIIFAIALVGVALLNVVGYGDESGNYAAKKFIPKLALALIAVNFTFLAARVILDVNNVLTTAVFSIPRSITTISDIAGGDSKGLLLYKKWLFFPDNTTLDTIKKENAPTTPGEPASNIGGIIVVDPECKKEADKWRSENPNSSDAPTCMTEIGAKTFSEKNWVWAMAAQFQGIQNLSRVAQVTGDLGSITINSLFSIIFTLIYGTAYIVMFVLLLARVIILWVAIMLSPIVALSIALPEITQLAGDKLDIKKLFLDNAFIPLKMSVPLTIGYIMLSQMSLAIDTNAPFIQDGPIDLTSVGEFVFGGTLKSLMYAIAATGVTWVAVFAAAEGDITGFAGFMQNSLQTLGQKASRWPTYLPIFPGSKGAYSAQAIWEVGNRSMEYKIRELEESQQGDLATDVFGADLAAKIGFGGGVVKAMGDLLGVAKDSAKDQRAMLQAIKSNSQHFATDDDAKNLRDQIVRQGDDAAKTKFAAALGLKNPSDLNNDTAYLTAFRAVAPAESKDTPKDEIKVDSNKIFTGLKSLVPDLEDGKTRDELVTYIRDTATADNLKALMLNPTIAGELLNLLRTGSDQDKVILNGLKEKLQTLDDTTEQSTPQLRTLIKELPVKKP